MSSNSNNSLAGTDHLRVQLVRGESGKVIYDSDKDGKKNPKLKFVATPVKFCPNCGKQPIPLIWICLDCGQKYQQVYDETSHKTMLIALPDEPEVEEKPKRVKRFITIPSRKEIGEP